MREKQMKMKIKCPECGDTCLTKWCSGEMGYNIVYDKYSKEITRNGLEYDEVSFDTYSCGCGYETTNDSDILVEVKE